MGELPADTDELPRTVLVDGQVAGNLVCFGSGAPGPRRIGYWLDGMFRGRGIASRALAEFLSNIRDRPLHAQAAEHDGVSLRTLHKNGLAPVGRRRQGHDGVTLVLFELAERAGHAFGSAEEPEAGT